MCVDVGLQNRLRDVNPSWAGSISTRSRHRKIKASGVFSSEVVCF